MYQHPTIWKYVTYGVRQDLYHQQWEPPVWDTPENLGGLFGPTCACYLGPIGVVGLAGFPYTDSPHNDHLITPKGSM